MLVRAPEFGSSHFHDAHSSFLEVSRAEGGNHQSPDASKDMVRNAEDPSNSANMGTLQVAGGWGLWSLGP